MIFIIIVMVLDGRADLSCRPIISMVLVVFRKENMFFLTKMHFCSVIQSRLSLRVFHEPSLEEVILKEVISVCFLCHGVFPLDYYNLQMDY